MTERLGNESSTDRKTPDFSDLLRDDIEEFIRRERPELTDEQVEEATAEVFGNVMKVANEFEKTGEDKS